MDDATRKSVASKLVYQRAGAPREVLADLTELAGYAGKHRAYKNTFTLGIALCLGVGGFSFLMGLWRVIPPVGVVALLFAALVGLIVSAALLSRSSNRAAIHDDVLEAARFLHGLALAAEAPVSLRLLLGEPVMFQSKRYQVKPLWFTCEGTLVTNVGFFCQLGNKTWSNRTDLGGNRYRITTYMQQSIQVEMRFRPGAFPHIESQGPGVVNRLQLASRLAGSVHVINAGGLLAVSGHDLDLTAENAPLRVGLLHGELLRDPVTKQFQRGSELGDVPRGSDLVAEDFRGVLAFLKRRWPHFAGGVFVLMFLLSILGALNNVNRYIEADARFDRAQTSFAKERDPALKQGFKRDRDSAEERQSDALLYVGLSGGWFLFGLLGTIGMFVAARKLSRKAAADAASSAAAAPAA